MAIGAVQLTPQKLEELRNIVWNFTPDEAGKMVLVEVQAVLSEQEELRKDAARLIEHFRKINEAFPVTDREGVYLDLFEAAVKAGASMYIDAQRGFEREISEIDRRYDDSVGLSMKQTMRRGATTGAKRFAIRAGIFGALGYLLFGVAQYTGLHEWLAEPSANQTAEEAAQEFQESYQKVVSFLSALIGPVFLEFVRDFSYDHRSTKLKREREEAVQRARERLVDQQRLAMEYVVTSAEAAWYKFIGKQPEELESEAQILSRKATEIILRSVQPDHDQQVYAESKLEWAVRQVRVLMINWRVTREVEDKREENGGSQETTGAAAASENERR